MHAISARPATQGDIAFLTELRLRTFNEHLVSAGIFLTLEEHRRAASANIEACSIFELADRPIGMMKVLRSADEWTVDQIQLEPEFQGHGLGTEVLRSLQQSARSEGVRLSLYVLKVSPALRLYERLGFSIVGEEEGMYAMRSEA
jgi:ribosomal protein S18 acetylase RimI-like enzyme